MRASTWYALWLMGVCVSAQADVITASSTLDGSAAPVGVSADRLAVIVNDDDPYSVEVSRYYAAHRHIPSQNIIHVRFVSGKAALSVVEFEVVKAQVDVKIPPGVQAMALTWVRPYRVDCMSITTAFAMGFDAQFCSSSCAETRISAYFNSDTRIPADSLGVIPTMSLAASDIVHAKALIDRGIASDGTTPMGTAYLVSTSDAARNVRAPGYANANTVAHAPLKIQIIAADEIRNRDDVMFYIIGARTVADIATNRFLPGAIADHLTSTGGDLLQTRQMSILRWLDAGATASYGSVAEPCAFVAKFPNPAVLIKHYLAGETLIESYWKSVAMPGQGIFIGEPLARPFAVARSTATVHSEKQR